MLVGYVIFMNHKLSDTLGIAISYVLSLFLSHSLTLSLAFSNYLSHNLFLMEGSIIMPPSDLSSAPPPYDYKIVKSWLALNM